jgi:hypothetical protein
MAPVAAQPSQTPLRGASLRVAGAVEGSLVDVAAAYFVMWDTVRLNRGHG